MDGPSVLDPSSPRYDGRLNCSWRQRQHHEEWCPRPDYDTMMAFTASAPDEQRRRYEQLQIATATTTLANMLNVALGSGILGMSRAFADGGWAYTTFLVVFFAGLCVVANCVVVRACVRFRATSLQALIASTHGKSASKFVMVAMVVYSWGGAAANLVMIGDFMHPACTQIAALQQSPQTSATASVAGGGADVTASPMYCSRRLWIGLLSTVVILPLALQPTITALGRPSMACSLAVFAMSAILCYRAVDAGHVASGVEPFPRDWSLQRLVTPTRTIAWAFAVQLGCPNVFAELADPINLSKDKTAAKASSESSSNISPTNVSKLDGDGGGLEGEERNQLLFQDTITAFDEDHAQDGRDTTAFKLVEARERRRVALMDRVIFIQAAMTAILYVVVGLSGYFEFGPDVAPDGNGLSSFPVHDIVINVVRVLVSVVAVVSYPVIHFTARNMAHDLLSGNDDGGGAPLLGTTRRVLLTIVFFACALLFAMSDADLGLIFTIFGSTCSLFVMLVVPATLLLQKRGGASGHIPKIGGYSFLCLASFLCVMNLYFM